MAAIASLFRGRRFVPTPRPLALTLDGHRFTFRPTFFGLVYLGMIAALLVGSINHNNNLGYLLTFLLTGILLVTLPHSYRNLRGITAQGGQALPVFAGQQAGFDLLLQGGSQDRPAIHLALAPELPLETDLGANQTKTVRLAYPARGRGLLRLDSLHLWTSYPLGLIIVRTRLDLALSCLVYPAPITGPMVMESGADNVDRVQALNLAPGREFTGLMPYRPGDSLHQAHWKSLAQGRELHTKLFAEGATGSMIFSLEALTGTDTENKLSRLCHMIVTADSRQLTYGLRLDGQFIAPAKGAAHARRCLEALALHP